MGVDEQLKTETLKWLEKCREEVVRVKASGPKGEEFLVNIKAYVSDTGHFLEKDDLVRAFEAIVWAWAWLEIGKDIGVLEEKV
ncbi:MAG: DUF357 domain-containing protein [Candidatus Aenigmarchaeota archaeon]|nr:DUF357 domain-containing protein [Candidatus Aenigmarchaeota archaeon]